MKSLAALTALAALAIIACSRPAVTPPAVVPTPIVIEKVVERLVPYEVIVEKKVEVIKYVDVVEKVYFNIVGAKFFRTENLFYVEFSYDTDGNLVPDLYERRMVTEVDGFLYFSLPVKTELDVNEDGVIDNEPNW